MPCFGVLAQIRRNERLSGAIWEGTAFKKTWPPSQPAPQESALAEWKRVPDGHALSSSAVMTSVTAYELA